MTTAGCQAASPAGRSCNGSDPRAVANRLATQWRLGPRPREPLAEEAGKTEVEPRAEADVKTAAWWPSHDPAD